MRKLRKKLVWCPPISKKTSMVSPDFAPHTPGTISIADLSTNVTSGEEKRPSFEETKEKAYNNREARTQEHLEPEERYEAKGEPQTQADLERIDDDIKSADAGESGTRGNESEAAEATPDEGEDAGARDEGDGRQEGRAGSEDEDVAPATPTPTNETIDTVDAPREQGVVAGCPGLH